MSNSLSNPKYKFYVNGDKHSVRQVIAVSTYAGKPVRGIAKCDPRDDFSIDTGKKLAAARCNLKVAIKRKKRAQEQVEKAQAEAQRLLRRYNEMQQYLIDANEKVIAAHVELDNLLNEI